jgi:Tat protein secretion system quality control protein TatD with DNase activity
LSPETKRGLENEPGNLPIIGDYLARFIGCELEKIAEWSYVNATNFYDI